MADLSTPGQKMSFEKLRRIHQDFARFLRARRPTLKKSRSNREDDVMKKVLIPLAAGALSVLAFAALAAPQPLTESDTGQLRPAGTVSVTGATNLDELQQRLAEKAGQQGATGYSINAAGGTNKMYGTATIYK